jgi:hypothetical protein
MGCGCGKSFSSGGNYGAGRSRGMTMSHVPSQRPTPPPVKNIQSRSLAARTQATPQPTVQGRRKV